jgi:3-deoxy-D-manno-octulosonic-acid transferase
MYLFYSMALSVCFLALLPYFAYQAIRNGKYSEGFWQRLGRFPPGPRRPGNACIWVHAVSIGEFLTAEPLIRALRRRFPSFRIAVSTTTLTGQRLAKARLCVQSKDRASKPDDAPINEPGAGEIMGVFYFPFDWTFAVRRSLSYIDPAAVIILETEIWPNFLRECHRRGIPVVIANGRISPRSHRRYMRIRRLFRRVLQNFSVLTMQSAGDAERAISLGANPSCVNVCGNLKYDVPIADNKYAEGDVSQEPTALVMNGSSNVTGDVKAEELDRVFQLSRCPNLVIAGSTAAGEEQMLLSALRSIKQVTGLEDARLLIAPRHPERFREVARLISSAGFSLAKRSECGPASNPGSVAADIILLDSIGELASVYRFGAVVFVGGSLVPRGGHNIIEPAAAARPIVVGPSTDNFRQIVSDFVAAKAVVQIPGGDKATLADELARTMIHLLKDKRDAGQMGSRAQEILVRNRGAVDRTIAAIAPLLPYGDQPAAPRPLAAGKVLG